MPPGVGYGQSGFTLPGARQRSTSGIGIADDSYRRREDSGPSRDWDFRDPAETPSYDFRDTDAFFNPRFRDTGAAAPGTIGYAPMQYRPAANFQPDIDTRELTPDRFNLGPGLDLSDLESDAYAGSEFRHDPLTQGQEFAETLTPETFEAPTAEDLMADPGYQFRRDEGMRGIQAAAAAGGTLNTGGVMRAAGRFNQGLAAQEYGAAHQRGLQRAGFNRAGRFGAFDRNLRAAGFNRGARRADALAGYTMATGVHDREQARQAGRFGRQFQARTGQFDRNLGAQFGAFDRNLGAQFGAFDRMTGVRDRNQAARLGAYDRMIDERRSAFDRTAGEQRFAASLAERQRNRLADERMADRVFGFQQHQDWLNRRGGLRRDDISAMLRSEGV